MDADYKPQHERVEWLHVAMSYRWPWISAGRSMEPRMAKVVDIAKVQRALNRAARNSRHGPADARAGRMRPVESSMMTGVAYDDETCELDIMFASGKTYRYFDVPADVYARLLDAESKGEFFNEEIKDEYQYAEVGKYHR